MTRIGLLTGGGDCPGLNAVIRAVVRRGLALGDFEFVGFIGGWAGVLEGDDAASSRASAPPASSRAAARSSGPRARTPTPTAPAGPRRSRARCASTPLDALIAIGGDDTLGVGVRLHATACPSSGCPRRSTTTSAAPT